MPRKSLFRQVADRVVESMGYFPVEKSQYSSLGQRAIMLNTQSKYNNTLEQISSNGLRKPGKISFKILRDVAKHDALIRICVNIIKKAISQCDWEIAVKADAPKDKKYYEDIRQKVQYRFEFLNPNGETLRMLLDKILEDVLILDAGAIEKVFTLDGTELAALHAVDGATIRPVLNEFGEFGSPAYYQYLNTKRTAEFEQSDLVYIMANPQADVDLFGYGMSPIESILLQVQASLEADMHNIKAFSKDNVPPGILDLGDMSNEEAEQFIATWNATVLGNTHGLKFVWGSDNPKKYVPFNTNNRDMQYAEYIEWLSKVKLSIYGLSSIDANLLQDVNRGTAEVQQQIAQTRGVMSYKSLIEEYFTRQIVWPMGGPVEDEDAKNGIKNDYQWLEFRFKKAQTLDEEQKQAQIHQTNIQSGIEDPNEIRAEQGKQPLLQESYEDDLSKALRYAEQIDAEEKVRV